MDEAARKNCHSDGHQQGNMEALASERHLEYESNNFKDLAEGEEVTATSLHMKPLVMISIISLLYC